MDSTQLRLSPFNNNSIREYLPRIAWVKQVGHTDMERIGKFIDD